jgi:hypothetical protein
MKVRFIKDHQHNNSRDLGILLEECCTTNGCQNGYHADDERDEATISILARRAPVRYRARRRFSGWTRWWTDQAPDTTDGPWLKPLEWIQFSQLVHEESDEEVRMHTEDQTNVIIEQNPTTVQTMKRKCSDAMMDMEENPRATQLRRLPSDKHEHVEMP